MLAIQTVGRPFVGFITGLSIGTFSILAMNDIVYNHFIQKLYGPVRQEVEQGATTSEDFSRITKTAAQSSKEFVQAVQPLGIKRVNVKQLFIEDQDYSTPEDHYFSFLRRKKEQEMLEKGAQYGPEDYFEDPKWQDTHQRQDYQKLAESSLKDIFGTPMGLKNAKENYKAEVEDEEEEEKYIQANPEYARDSEDFDSRNQFGFFKVTKVKPQPLQKEPEKLTKKVAQIKADRKQNESVTSLPQFNLHTIQAYMKNPDQMKKQIRELQRKIKAPKLLSKAEEQSKPAQNAMLKSLRSVLSQTEQGKEFKVVGQSVGISSLNADDKKRLHKLATKARYQ